MVGKRAPTLTQCRLSESGTPRLSGKCGCCTRAELVATGPQIGSHSTQTAFSRGGCSMNVRKAMVALMTVLAIAVAAGPLHSQDKDADGWIKLFNGKDLTGWKLKQEKYTVTKFVNDQGEAIPGAKEGKVDQKVAVVDSKGKVIEGAKID